MNTFVIKVLLIDDDEDDYIIARDQFSEIESQEYQVDWVSSYEEAIVAISNEAHDVCLVDYRLGQRDGLELIKEAIANGCKMPLILLTGQGDRSVDMEAMRAGAADYLVKGRIDADMLERSLRYSIERKREQDARAALEEQLLQAQKLESIGQLAGGIAHDFNNLMTPIVGYTQMALRSLPEESKEFFYFQEINKAADRATNLIQQLLAFSRRQVVQFHMVNLNDLIQNIEMMLKRLIGEHIEMVFLPSEEIGMVKVDPSQIEQVIMNLVVNGRDAMPSGGTLVIETDNIAIDESFAKQHLDVPPGNYVMLAVTDTGLGIPDEIKSKIFEPFFTTKEKGKGTGLGLSTCYGIVAQNDGHIWVYSEVGSGTTFKIYLPRIGAAPSPIADRKDSGSLPRGTETILLVEDEVQVRELTSRVLRQQGYNVMEAPNGVEALSMAQINASSEIHIMLTDVIMPLIGGTELSAKLSSIHPETKVLYTSGYTDEAIIIQGVLEPGTHFLQKPYSLSALTQKIRAVLDESKTATNKY